MQERDCFLNVELQYDETEIPGIRTAKEDSAQNDGVSGGGKLVTSYDNAGTLIALPPKLEV